jgi:hypothetical protein
MTQSLFPAPELEVLTSYITDRPLPLTHLGDRAVLLVAFQVPCPKSLSRGISQLHGFPQAQRSFDFFAPTDVAVIGRHATFEHRDTVGPAAVTDCIQEFRLKFPIALDENSANDPILSTMERYNMRGAPSLRLIDKPGLLRTHSVGPVDDLRIGAQIGARTQEPVTRVLARSSAA